MDNNNNYLVPVLLLVAGTGLLVYLSQQQDGPTYIPAGGRFGGYRNNRGVGVYIDAAGRIVDELGNLVGSILDIINNANHPDNEWTDEEWDAWVEEDDYWAQDFQKRPAALPGNTGYSEYTVIEKTQPTNTRLKVV